jgi:ketosteroid isomerase-like protein
MLSELNKTVARRYFKAYETGNIDAVMEFIDPNYVLHPPHPTPSEPEKNTRQHVHQSDTSPQ